MSQTWVCHSTAHTGLLRGLHETAHLCTGAPIPWEALSKCWLLAPSASSPFQPHKMLVQKRLPETKHSPSHCISCDVRVVRVVSAPISFPTVLSICLWLLMIAWPGLSCFWSSKLEPVSFYLIICIWGQNPRLVHLSLHSFTALSSVPYTQ